MAEYKTWAGRTPEHIEWYIANQLEHGKALLINMCTIDFQIDNEQEHRFKKFTTEEIISDDVTVVWFWSAKKPTNWQCIGEKEPVISFSHENSVYDLIRKIGAHSPKIPEEYQGWPTEHTFSQWRASDNAFCCSPYHSFIVRKNTQGQVERLWLGGRIFCDLIRPLPKFFFMSTEAARVFYRAIGKEIIHGDWLNIRPTIFLEYWQPFLNEIRAKRWKNNLLNEASELQSKNREQRKKLTDLFRRLNVTYHVQLAENRIDKLLIADLE